jgi:hypothetical protein
VLTFFSIFKTHELKHFKEVIDEKEDVATKAKGSKDGDPKERLRLSRLLPQDQQMEGIQKIQKMMKTKIEKMPR